MLQPAVAVLWACLLVLVATRPPGEHSHDETQKITIRMPHVIPSRKDELICHSREISFEKPHYIVKFDPHASKNTAHHMLLLACRVLASNESNWKCGIGEPTSVCANGEREEIMYAWALDAPSKQLPTGVGFRIGGKHSVKQYVLQVHYARKLQASETDTSGMTLHITNKPQPFQAGYFILGNWGYIPPYVQNFHMDSACDYPNSYPIYAMAYRTHSHNLGVVTSGYRIRNGTWTEIGRMSPKKPQMFYASTNKDVEIKRGDIVAGRCTMTNPTNHPVIIGPANNDEMCNFYIMYYTRNRGQLPAQYCFRDAQQFHWKDFLENIPENAGSLKGIPGLNIEPQVL